jgi:hypothetical protein
MCDIKMGGKDVCTYPTRFQTTFLYSGCSPIHNSGREPSETNDTSCRTTQTDPEPEPESECSTPEHRSHLPPVHNIHRCLARTVLYRQRMLLSSSCRPSTSQSLVSLPPLLAIPPLTIALIRRPRFRQTPHSSILLLIPIPNRPLALVIAFCVVVDG